MNPVEQLEEALSEDHKQELSALGPRSGVEPHQSIQALLDDLLGCFEEDDLTVYGLHSSPGFHVDSDD